MFVSIFPRTWFWRDGFWLLKTIVSLDVISHADLYVIGILKGDYAVKFKVTYKLNGRISEQAIRIYNLI